MKNKAGQQGEPLIWVSVKSKNWPSKKELTELAINCFNACKLASSKLSANSEVGFIFANDTYLRELNLQWRNIDKPTNVLSFPIEKSTNKQFEKMLGDVVISFETTLRESKADNIPFKHHLSHLIVHGILHLLNFDHETQKDAVIMETLEGEILGTLNIPNPYDEN